MLSLQIKILLYNSLIVSHININCCIMARNFQSNRIIKLKKKVVRTITLSNYNSQNRATPLKTQHVRKYMKFLNYNNYNCIINTCTKTCQFIYKTGDNYDTRIKYTPIKFNTNLQRNVLGIICQFYLTTFTI